MLHLYNLHELYWHFSYDNHAWILNDMHSVNSRSGFQNGTVWKAYDSDNKWHFTAWEAYEFKFLAIIISISGENHTPHEIFIHEFGM